MTLSIDKPIVLDILDQTKPLLSATSDIPIVETKPDATNEGKPPELEAPAGEDKAAVDETETKEESATSPGESPASDEPKKAKGVQKRLDELTKQREDERRRAEAAEARLDRALAALERPREVAPMPVEEPEDPEPSRPVKSLYADPDAYDSALDAYAEAKAAWIAKREAKTYLADETRKSHEARIVAEQKVIQETHRKRVEKTMEKYPDYKQVAESPDISISMPMAAAILHSEHGPEIAYHLGKNPSEAAKIATLPIPLQLMELGLIVSRFSSTPVKPVVSNAPKPIRPLASNSESSAELSSDEEPSMEEYAAQRKKQLQDRARH